MADNSSASSPTGSLPANFWPGLWEHAAEGVDALGRNTYSMTNAFGNWIVAMIQAGKGEYPTITYQDDNAKYITISVVAIAVVVALIFILK